MPTNLPPEYFEADRRFRAAKSTQEKIICLEELLSTIPKHKGTDKLRADLRRRLAKLKSENLVKKKPGRHESIYHIEKEGAARIVILGPANVGKSSLTCALTNATPKISPFPFTTWTPTPGMLMVKDVQIQLIDTPPLSREHIETELIDLVRNSDLILLIVDLQTDPFRQLEETTTILNDYGISLPCEGIHSNGQSNMISHPFIVVVNKTDNEKLDEDFQVFCDLLDQECTLIAISAQSGRNLEQLKEHIFTNLGIMRIYAKPPGKEPDFSAPFVLNKGCTVEDLAAKIHKDFYSQLKTARVWGSGVYEGQLVGRDHILQDGDVVELHL